MSEYGVLSTGFKRKRLDALLNELNVELKSIFGVNFNVSPESPDGQINGVISESNANLWELAEIAYNSINPSFVTGSTQDILYQLNNVYRMEARSSTVVLTLSGDEGTLIPAGSLVSTFDTNIQFSTDASVTIPVSGSITVNASCVTTGPIDATSNTITQIDTPIVGWNSVTNLNDAILGADLESDSDFRARRNRVIARNSQALLDSIISEIRSLSGVIEVKGYENDTNIDPDSNGLPAYSIYMIVLGGDDDEIANAIYIKKTLGAKMLGNTTVQVLTSSGYLKDIKFSRPVSIPIYVEVNLTTFSDYPVNGDDLIKQAIIDYALGELIENRKFGIGSNVIHSELYTPINTISGHTVDSLFIKKTFPADESLDIVIGIDEIAEFTLSNIVVNS